MENQQKDIQQLWIMVEKIRFCMLTHFDKNGDLYAYPLTTQNKIFDYTHNIYFFISQNSSLYQGLTNNPVVNISYSNISDDQYISLSGKARFLDDLSLKRELWTSMVQLWFPNGVEDPCLTLLAVKVNRAEYWNGKESKIVQLCKMASSAITGHLPKNPAEHKKIDWTPPSTDKSKNSS